MIYSWGICTMQINNMPDLNEEVDYKALLGLISTLSIFVTKINDNEAAVRTIEILGTLIHADHDPNRKYLVDTSNYLLQ